jgi:adenine-specific DNA-methyltransferase
MDKLKLHTPDFTASNIEKLVALFPSCLTEVRDEKGVLTRAIDFDQLRQELSHRIVEGPRERYHLDWPGKREALLAANTPIAKTLRPCRKESVEFDTTKNLFIEGDNLDALKLLQETYLGKVKVIYCDPPYNTGGDFIYHDDFAEDAENYLFRSNQKDESGQRLVANLEANGRFHSDWLTMMYPRLKLAWNLLRDDGVLLVSINDIEAPAVRFLLNQIFGEHNFLCQFVWNNEGNVDQQSKIKGVHEYIVAYVRDAEALAPPTVIDPNIEETSKLYNEQIENSITKNGPANPPSEVLLPKGFPAAFDTGTVSRRDDQWPHILDDVRVEGGKVCHAARVKSGWSSRNLLELFIKNGCVPILDSTGKETWFALTATGAIYGYKKRSDSQGHVLSVIRNVGTTKQNSSMLAEWGITFSYPKPLLLLQYLVEIFTASDKSHVVADLFAGSGTTGHAVQALNASDNGDREFILIQFPEKLKVPAKHLVTVADLTKERLKLAGEQCRTEHATTAPNLDIGFRVLKIDTSNMADVYYAPDAVKQTDLVAHTDNIKSDRTPEDLLFQVLVDWGVDLSLPITQETVAKKKVFFVDGNALAACFDPKVSEDLVKELAKRKPLRAVFRDSSYDSDSVKINVEQVFKLLSPETEVKSL